MDHKELLRKYIEQESNNLLISSENYLMITPRPGCEDVWREAKEPIAGLQRIQMMLDIQALNKEAAHALDQQGRHSEATISIIRGAIVSELDSFQTGCREANCGNRAEA